MAGPLTYPPEILIASTVELPPEFGEEWGEGGEGINEAWFELAVFMIELLVELIF